MNERLRRKIEQKASRFLEPGESVRAGIAITGVPMWVTLLAPLLILIQLISVQAAGKGSVLGTLLIVVVYSAVFAGILAVATRKRRGVVALTDRNVYVIRPGQGEAAVKQYPRGSVSVGFAGSVLAPTIVVGDERLHIAGANFQIRQAILAAAQTPAVEAEAAAARRAASTAAGPLGQPRGIVFAILMSIVTFGIYGLYWLYVTFEEMKRHSSAGPGGVKALLLYFATAIVFLPGVLMYFLTPREVGRLYERDGQPAPVGTWSGLLVIPLGILLIPAIIWFVRLQGSLNRYWIEKGALAPEAAPVVTT